MLRICASSDLQRVAAPLLDSPKPSFDDVLHVLHGLKEPPSSKFLSIKDTNLDEDSLAALADALKNSPFAGGLRLRGCFSYFSKFLEFAL
jgi:hypothetical protein